MGRSSYGGGSSVKKKWYAVQIGYTPGVYDSWDQAEKQVKSQPLGVCSMECAAVAKFKGFTQSEGVDAAIAYMGGEALYKAWTLFRNEDLDAAEAAFKAVRAVETSTCSMNARSASHGEFRIEEERVRLAELEKVREIARERQAQEAVDFAAREVTRAATMEAARKEAAAAADKQRDEAALARAAEEARSAAELETEAKRLSEQARAAKAEALKAEAEALADKKETERAVEAARAARKQASEGRAEKAEEERLAAVERNRSLAAEGRKKTASGKYLSDAAQRQGTHNRRSGQTAKRTKKRNEKKAQEKLLEAVAIQQAQLAAEQTAFAEQQAAAGAQLSEVRQARSATAAIAGVDPGAAKEHKRLVDSWERMGTQLAETPSHPGQLSRQMSRVAAEMVTASKKTVRDKQQRERQQKRQKKSAGDKAAQNQAWTQNHLSNQRPQDRWSKLSRKHSVEKRKVRKNQKKKKKEQGRGRNSRHPIRLR